MSNISLSQDQLLNSVEVSKSSDVAASLSSLKSFLTLAVSEAHKLFVAATTLISVGNRVTQIARQTLGALNGLHKTGVGIQGLIAGVESGIEFAGVCGELSSAVFGVAEAASVAVPALEVACIGATEVLAALAGPFVLGASAVCGGFAMSAMGAGLLLSNHSAVQKTIQQDDSITLG